MCPKILSNFSQCLSDVLAKKKTKHQPAFKDSAGRWYLNVFQLRRDYGLWAATATSTLEQECTYQDFFFLFSFCWLRVLPFLTSLENCFFFLPWTPPAYRLLQLLIQFHSTSTALRAASGSFSQWDESYSREAWRTTSLFYSQVVVFPSSGGRNFLIYCWIFFLICCFNLQPGMFELIKKYPL